MQECQTKTVTWDKFFCASDAPSNGWFPPLGFRNDLLSAKHRWLRFDLGRASRGSLCGVKLVCGVKLGFRHLVTLSSGPCFRCRLELQTIKIPLASIPAANSRAILSPVMTRCVKTAPRSAALRSRSGPRTTGRRDDLGKDCRPRTMSLRLGRPRRLLAFRLRSQPFPNVAGGGQDPKTKVFQAYAKQSKPCIPSVSASPYLRFAVSPSSPAWPAGHNLR